MPSTASSSIGTKKWPSEVYPFRINKSIEDMSISSSKSGKTAIPVDPTGRNDWTRTSAPLL
ncbi:hypothetical protein BT69DRAFT_1289742 [Atractiella rhizophila]|nr:hypothetical protein BT69DRAFT_1289742 [Atractiella rhizophila]